MLALRLRTVIAGRSKQRKKKNTKAVDILFMRRDFAYKGINPLFCTIFTHNFYSTNCVLRFHDLIDSLSLLILHPLPVYCRDFSRI